MTIESLRKRIGKINHRPTEAQKSEGNYKKGTLHIHGLRIKIENAKGSIREGISHSGVRWKATLPAHYGYISKSTANDGDHVDCYISDNPESARKIYVIDQKHHQPGSSKHHQYDEAKVMIGYPDTYSALKAYRAAFSDKHDRVLACTVMTIAKFKEWLHKHDTTKPVLYFKDSRKKT